MKKIIILLIVFVLGLSLGYMGNTLMALRHAFSPSTAGETSNQNGAPNNGSGSASGSDTPTAAPKEPVTVSASALTEGQKALLIKLGIDPTKFVVTPKMVTCAEDTLGPTRVAEIIKGDTPTTVEAVRLSPCLNP